MIYKTKRIRRALAYIAQNTYRSYVTEWTIDDDVLDQDVLDALEWIQEQSQEPKPKAIDVLLREMGAPELFPIDKLE